MLYKAKPYINLTTFIILSLLHTFLHYLHKHGMRKCNQENHKEQTAKINILSKLYIVKPEPHIPENSLRSDSS